VAFLAGARNTSDLAGIFTGMGGTFTDIVDETGNLLLRSNPDINNRGTVAFAAEFKATGVQGIFTGNGGPVITVADTSGPFRDFLGGPVINDRGKAVFFATLDQGVVGVFSGPDPVADKVIKTSDPLFGSVVSDLPTNGARLGLNNSGQVAFVATLADGTGVIVRADPVTFAGTPGKPNCLGKSVSALARQYVGLDTAAEALGYPSVQILQKAIMEYCERQAVPRDPVRAVPPPSR
jgi:hypothetical protein